ncbi:hypothetical protein LX32DRAFT_282440 [Colletotrichum zoysiae]|uniref:Uncharacterized protein n=1 Tax=Colletotrichum zoysiae TaxID=1216348 RepID=A0AAD9H1Z6_9PEZI|nr:hypothetical protein LX32DRAFT_282440 [Colletotrichum zoysiae]
MTSMRVPRQKSSAIGGEGHVYFGHRVAQVLIPLLTRLGTERQASPRSISRHTHTHTRHVEPSSSGGWADVFLWSRECGSGKRCVGPPAWIGSGRYRVKVFCVTGKKKEKRKKEKRTRKAAGGTQVPRPHEQGGHGGTAFVRKRWNTACSGRNRHGRGTRHF